MGDCSAVAGLVKGGMWWKLYQAMLAFAGGSYAISEGLTGYAVGFFAFIAAAYGTLATARIIDLCRRAHGRYRRPL